MKFASALVVFLSASQVTSFAPASSKSTTTSLFSTTTTTTDEKKAMRGKQLEHTHCTAPGDRDILIRAAKGEITERTPVWLCRQAGRYMEAFRAYSTKYPFRQRSETSEMAIELSLQCHRAYGMDGIIMFSDILTPLPTLGIDFDVVAGVGPVISTKIENEMDVTTLDTVDETNAKEIFDEKLPFIRDILGTLSKEAEDANTSLIGFIGAPFTLAAYTIEGKSSKHCLDTKKLMMADERNEDKTLPLFLDKVATMIGHYACHQIDCGAQVIQLFESWAHQCSPRQFELYAKPASQKVISIIKEKHPDTPVIYFANGGASYLELQRDMGCDMIAVDWSIDIGEARKILGPDIPISGNIDPTILFGSKEQIEQSVRDCIDKAGGPGNRHLLNLGHGVMQGTPEEAVGWLIDEAKRYTGKKE
ncbi:Uroporphyrinogen decarboxylase [Fragilariopsis cylindrus CCMP1102]|uniref:uroporphyrinogen decarboxylase n=1 Tax=Fragilariopsis cylindrus CCMP1102 TaxID=635003 RepID=A0A1E7F9W9_9STRA|nr:Uroporphyrinogen decarboxylase [Fragilariopsis cylindrus CCMP1102]|eukprot:OEU14972.1 Uroporphyrinogen decarboxylase [Fragilariopsis cylindrus CCMP1102]